MSQSKNTNNKKTGNNQKSGQNKKKAYNHKAGKKQKAGQNKKVVDPHLAREKAKYGEPIASREYILEMLRREKAPLQFNALAEKLGITEDPKALDALSRRVRAMQRDGQLIENRKHDLMPVDADALIAGRISAHPDGFGFLVPDKNDGKGDIYLHAKQMRLVLHGDRAVVCLSGVDRRGRREGRIVEILERANKSVVGRFMEEKGVIVIAPDNKRIHLDLMIPEAERGSAVHGDIVVAEIVEQPNRHNPPVGKVVEVLGKHMEAGMEIDMSLRSHDIPFEWPDAVLDQANTFASGVQDKDKMGRKDVTRLPLVTIDGADARDFDDAVYCEKTNSGWRLLVAIADVAHYVSTDSPLDKEAESRGTSVYFPGRVVPMLPEVLSNGLCSINPDVERLCMLCEMSLDETGGIKRTRFYNAVMLSHARLTYTQVNEILTDEMSSLQDTYSEVVPQLQDLHQLYKILSASRADRGVIEFASTETRILFDDDKKISEIIPIVRNDAHKLIEECMILANVAAAGFLEQHNVPALYRVHHGPKADRLEDLRAFLALRGLSLGGGDKPAALDYAVLSKQIEDRPDKSVISTIMLRSMQQAVYQPKNEGHFGLALNQYAHFTSPIRRYPDLLVHRAIKHVLKRESIINYRYSREQMNALGESCSKTERRAEEATRDVVSWLKCEFMQDHIGSEYPGVITAVTSFGLFIELTDIHVEGLLHVTNLAHDYYKFEQAAQAMIGERTGKQYRLGDPIMVKVAAVNLEDRKIDFAELGVEKNQSSKPKHKSDKTRKSDKHRKQPSYEADAAPTKKPKKHKKKKNRKTEKDTPGTVVSQKAQVQSPQSKVVDGKSGDKQSTGKKRDNKKGVWDKAGNEQEVTKQRVSKKTTSKKATEKKAASADKGNKKVVAKKTAAKKVTAKKTAAKKVASKKSVTKKTVAKKVTSKKTVAKKTAAKKTASKKTVAKKTATKKPVAKKAASKKTVSKKATSKKTVAKKTASKKTASKKTAAKKVTSKKVGEKKPAVKSKKRSGKKS